MMITNRLHRHTRTRHLTAAFCMVMMMIPAALFAQQQSVRVEAVDGRVEIQLPDSGSWQTLNEGDEVPMNARISTGFGATARLAVGQNSVVTVRALTRLTINEVVEQEDVERSDMTLEVGRVRGEVRRAADRQTQFELRSPTATASVRGTSFDFDGEELIVLEGVVALSNPFGREHQVSQGEESSSRGAEPPENPRQARAERSRVTHVTTSGGGGDDTEETITEVEPTRTRPAPIRIIEEEPDDDPIIDDDPDTGTVIIEWDFGEEE